MVNEIFGIDNAGPRAGTVHQGRLVIVGCPAVPDLVMASKVSGRDQGTAGETESVDFAVTETQGEGEDTREVATPASGFWFEQVSARANNLHGVIQQEALLLMGTHGESAIPAGPFTAAQVSIRENSWYGSERGVTPLIVGGQILFVQEGRDDLRNIRWDEIEQKFVAGSTLERAGKVFKRAKDVSFAVSAGRRPDEAYVVDEEDGHIAVFSMPNGAWANWKTQDGKFLGAAVPSGHHMFLVERAGQPGLEYFDPDGPMAEDYTDNGPNDGDKVPISARFELLPFVAPRPEGATRSVTKTRILDVAIDFATDELGVPQRDKPGNTINRVLKDRVRRDVQTHRQAGEFDAAEALLADDGSYDSAKWPRGYEEGINRAISTVKVEGVAGWEDRSFVSMTTTDACEIAGVSYRAVG